MQDPLRLILVTHRQQTPLPEYLEFIRLCVASGITAVQLREKNATPEFLYEFGLPLKRTLSEFQVPLIINDYLQVAQALDAEGVHLGQTDGDSVHVRATLGEEKIIGLSIESSKQLHQANLLPISYVAASAVFASRNKSDTKTLWGLTGLSEFVKKSKHPVVAIGGINHTNAHDALKTGIAGIAVIDAIHQASAPDLAVRALRQMIDESMRGEG
jgi:thiamine-phosphate pyrophosphorylase